MQNQTSIDELIVARHKLAQSILDEVITTQYRGLADKAMEALCDLDLKIMSVKIGRKARRNHSSSGKNKHKQPRNRV